MRWCFTDKVDAFAPWRLIRTRKAVSLEEGCLYEVFEREGVLPETLLIEVCVEAVRWLTSASSDFSKTATISSIEEFAFCTEAKMGDLLAVLLEVADRTDDSISVTCWIECGSKKIAEGRMTAYLLPLAEHLERGITQDMWRELYGTT